jgi:sialic acid synthase SpsE
MTFIIAEAGVNHNGDTDLAKKLIDAAVTAGADAVKFQVFRPEHLAIEGAPLAEYQKRGLNQKISQRKMLSELAL